MKSSLINQTSHANLSALTQQGTGRKKSVLARKKSQIKDSVTDVRARQEDGNKFICKPSVSKRKKRKIKMF